VLTDFGLSVILGGFTNVSCRYSDGKTGAIAWAAPELLGYPSPQPSTESDTYSFACIMYLVRNMVLK
jgi:serine/threonine protein kinase